MTEPQKRPLGAADMTASELMAAQDPKQFDGMIAELVRVRESAHDRERQATAAEAQLEEKEAAIKVATSALDRDAVKVRKEFDAREAAIAEREAKQADRDAWWQRVEAWIAEWKAEDAEWKAKREAWAVQSCP